MMRHIRMAALLGAIVMVAPAQAEESAVQLTVGESKTVLLPSNPSTGYGWQVAEAAEVVSVELSYENSPELRRMPGAPRNTVVTFTGAKPGAGAVRLIYSRPWEKGKASLETRVFTITVK